jgi:hypothetical protein
MSVQMPAGCGIGTIFGWQNHNQAALLQLNKISQHRMQSAEH